MIDLYSLLMGWTQWKEYVYTGRSDVHGGNPRVHGEVYWVRRRKKLGYYGDVVLQARIGDRPDTTTIDYEDNILTMHYGSTDLIRKDWSEVDKL